MSERITAVNDFVAAGFEVHLNLSPVIVYKDWLKDYRNLLTEVDDTLSPTAKAQLKAEVIFLTHNEHLHEVNLAWHPKAEDLLWTPHNQEAKTSQTGGDNVRYLRGFKGRQVRALHDLMNEVVPYCTVRYAF